MNTRIYIDPGHGGSDPGAVGYIQERPAAAKIAAYMNQYLLTHYVCETKISRGTTNASQRADEANAWNAGLFCSIHLNAAGGDGYENYLYSTANRKVGEIFWKHVKATGQNAHGNPIKYNPKFTVLLRTKMIAILNEMAFVDNLKDIRDWDEEAEWAVFGSALAKAAAECQGLAAKKVVPPSVSSAKKIYDGALPIINVGRMYTKRPFSTKLWQKFLNWAIDAGLEVDGIFGPLTQGATLRFQRLVGIYADGIAGPITYKYAKGYRR